MSDFPVLLKQDVLDYQKEALALPGELKGAAVILRVDMFCASVMRTAYRFIGMATIFSAVESAFQAPSFCAPPANELKMVWQL